MKKLFIIIITIITSLLVISCENFLRGSNLIQQIDEIAWLANKERPTAKIVSPVQSPNGDYKNASIIIKFSQPMDTSTFKSGFSVTDNENNSILDYYSPAKWNEELTEVTLTAIETKLLPIQSGNFFNITISLSTEIKNYEGVPLKEKVSETYKLNSNVDKEAPVFVSTMMGFSFNINSDQINNDNFIEGEVTNSNQDNIFNTNIIRDYFQLWIEGHDYGGNQVFANIDLKRVYDIDGNPVNEENHTAVFNIKYYEEYNTNMESVTVLLNEEDYRDGLYRVEISLKDSANNKSDEAKVYYIIRDTEFYLDQSAKIQTCESDGTYTITSLKFFNSLHLLSDYSKDVYFNYNGRQYSTPVKKLLNYLSYGLSPNDPNMKRGIKLVDLATDWHDGIMFELPQELRDYKENNKDKDIYIEVLTSDIVGNYKTKSFYIPKQTGFFCYNYSNGKVTLNFENRSKIENKEVSIENYTTETSYRIFYAERNSELSDYDLLLTRNRNNSNATDFFQVDDDSFNIDPNKSYIAAIQPIYIQNFNGNYAGYTLGLPTIVNNISANTKNNNELNNIDISNFTISKQIGPKNSGLTTIKIENNFQKDPNLYYYYGWSTDNENWNYFSNNTFTVPTYIAPNEDTVKDDVFINSLMSGYPDTYYTDGYAAVFVSNGSSSKHESKPIQFNSNEDNTPPYTSSWIKDHNLVMSPDGKYFTTNYTLVYDNEFNNPDHALYRYAPYSSLWGDNINFYTKNEIYSLPCGLANIDSSYNKSSNNTKLDSYVRYKIPINGLSDGQYVFFYDYTDTKGNSAVGTIGKISIRTYKEKPKVKYENGDFIVELKVSPDELMQCNKQYTQLLFTHEGENRFSSINGSSEYDGIDNAKHYRRRLTPEPIDQLVYSTKDMNVSANTLSLNIVDGQRTKPNDIFPNAFYKFYVLGYNYDETTGLYFDTEEAFVKYDETKDTNKNSYDMLTDEICSIPTYYFIPDGNTDINLCKTFMEKSTARVYSNQPVLIEVYSSLYDLGNDIDQWTRRGNLIHMHTYNSIPFPKDENSGNIKFNIEDAISLLIDNPTTENCYFTVVAHFANNTDIISNVFKR